LFFEINETATGKRIYQGLISRAKKNAMAPTQAAIAARTGRFINGIKRKDVYFINPPQTKGKILKGESLKDLPCLKK
jgi:hypothetical protein